MYKLQTEHIGILKVKVNHNDISKLVYYIHAIYN